MSEDSPQQFGDYHLLEKIATGGMAEVWRARLQGPAGFEKILVIKKVLDSLGRDTEFINLFFDEARIAVQLQHVNIVQVYDLGEVDNTYFMAMEYVHGLDLSKLMARSRHLGPFPIPLALFIFSEVMKALDFAHSKADSDGNPLRIVHCDISPQNVLISFSGEVRITDFGISRAAFQSPSLHEVVRGKYAYMSPEQVNGKALDGRSDIFSMGIVLYEILTGRRLFKAKTRDQTLDRVRRAEVPSLRGYRMEISEELEGVLLKTLSRRPGDRYMTAGQVVEDIGRIMVKEGYRANNAELAAYVKDITEKAKSVKLRPAALQDAKPRNIVVLSVEASAPPRSMAKPRIAKGGLGQEWMSIVAESGGEVWETGDGSLLVCWLVEHSVNEALQIAINTSVMLQKITKRAGYRLCAGIVPGATKIFPGSNRPPPGWELAGPFYLARWMMNFSAHRGRILLTQVGKNAASGVKVTPLGSLAIMGNRYINLFEVG